MQACGGCLRLIANFCCMMESTSVSVTKKPWSRHGHFCVVQSSWDTLHKLAVNNIHERTISVTKHRLIHAVRIYLHLLAVLLENSFRILRLLQAWLITLLMQHMNFFLAGVGVGVQGSGWSCCSRKNYVSKPHVSIGEDNPVFCGGSMR